MSEDQKEKTEKVAKMDFSKEDIDKHKGMAILAYILFFIPLLTDAKESPFVKFHIKQSLLLVIASVLVSVIGAVIPFLGALVAPIASLAVFVLWIIGLMHAINGEAKEVPIIGKYAEQYLKF